MEKGFISRSKASHREIIALLVGILLGGPIGLFVRLVLNTQRHGQAPISAICTSFEVQGLCRYTATGVEMAVSQFYVVCMDRTEQVLRRRVVAGVCFVEFRSYAGCAKQGYETNIRRGRSFLAHGKKLRIRRGHCISKSLVSRGMWFSRLRRACGDDI